MYTFYGLIDGKNDTYKIAEKIEKKLNILTNVKEMLTYNTIEINDSAYGTEYYIRVYEKDEDHNNQTYMALNNCGDAEVLIKAILQIFGGQFKVNDEKWEKIDKTTKIEW